MLKPPSPTVYRPRQRRPRPEWTHVEENCENNYFIYKKPYAADSKWQVWECHIGYGRATQQERKEPVPGEVLLLQPRNKSQAVQAFVVQFTCIKFPSRRGELGLQPVSSSSSATASAGDAT